MSRVITVHDVGQGLFEIHRNRVPLMAAPVDLDYAKDVIRRMRTPDEHVELIEMDGYRTDITKEFTRRSRHTAQADLALI